MRHSLRWPTTEVLTATVSDTEDRALEDKRNAPMKPYNVVRVTLLAVASLCSSGPFILAQTNPVVIGASGEYWGSAERLDFSANHVFLATRNSGYQHWVYDVSTPSNPVPVGPIAPYGTSITISGGYAYLLGSPNVDIYDISNPTNARAVGSLTNSGKVAVSGNLAYLAGGSSGIYIYDISNPTNPIALGHTTNNYNGFAADLGVSGNYAYVANGADGVRIYDVSNPTNPFSVGPSGLSVGAELITVSGDYAYVGVGQTNSLPDWGTTIYNIANPTNPVRGGHIAGVHGEASVSGNYLYIANGHIWIFDVSNFNQPISAGYYADGGEWLTDIKVSGNYAYVSGDSCPLFVFWLGAQTPPQLEISVAANSRLVLSWPTPTAAFAVQQNAELKTTGWRTLTNNAVVEGSHNQITVPAPTNGMFYRLILAQ